MQDLRRRPSGIYVFCLAVPAALRTVIGKREIIISTGTRGTALTKIVVAAAAAQWRQRFLDLSRLKAVFCIDSMEHHEILRIATGSPTLLAGGHLSLPLASATSGLSVDHLLRAAGDGKVSLHSCVGVLRGHLVPEDQLEVFDPEAGRSAGLVIPPVLQLPSGAVPHVAEGVLPLLRSEGVDRIN